MHSVRQDVEKKVIQCVGESSSDSEEEGLLRDPSRQPPPLQVSSGLA